MTHIFKRSAIIAITAALTLTAPISANAGEIGKRALKGAVAGAVISEITGGDAKQGAAIGATAGALSGAINKDRDRNHRAKNRSGKHKKAGKR